MRRLFSILLLACFALPFVSPLLVLGEDADAGVPICCRRNGAHHCLTSAMLRAAVSDDATRVRAPLGRCPYSPATVASAHAGAVGAPGTAEAIFAEVVSHPAVAAQTECKLRVSRDRARQKRGPPLSHL